MLDPVIRDFARAKNFGSISFHLPDGAIGTHVLWVDADDDHVLINTEVHRAKVRAVRRDPRVTVTIWVKDDPYRFAEVRGRVVEMVVGPEAEEHIHVLSRRYTGHDHEPGRTRTDVEIHLMERVILKIAPDFQQTFAV